MQSINPCAQDLSFLQCYICFQIVKKPRMCPHCSKLACQGCLRTWIEQSKPQCPHCRKALLLGSFADCQRFVNDIKHLLASMQSNQKMKEKCMDHRIEMTYYCEDCKDAICSDCGMFGKHRSHKIIHLSKVYQQNKNKILNELAKFDNKIELIRKNGAMIKQDLQRLQIQMGQKKNFIQEYFVTLIQRIDEEYKEKKERVEMKYDQHVQEIEFLDNFRDTICQELECKSEKELITKSQDFVDYIRNLGKREFVVQEESYTFDTIHELVPKYNKFSYTLKNYSQLPQTIIYSSPFQVNGIEWRLKIYPRGNGGAKNTHLSVFLQLSKGEQNENKYEYKIELLNHIKNKESTIREYSSKFDIGECWGYNQFIAISELTNGYLDHQDNLHFLVNVRNPTYRSLVRDQQRYIKTLQGRLNGVKVAVGVKMEKMNQESYGQSGVRLEDIAFAEEKEEVKVQENLESDRLEEFNAGYGKSTNYL